MISIAAGVFCLVVIFLLWQRQRPAFIAGFIILYSLAYRTVDVVYLDLFGPVYAIEIERHVGGNAATPMFVLASMLFVIPLWIIASERRIMKGIEAPVGRGAYLAGLQRGAFAAAAAVIGFLYLDMLRIGVIPLFSRMDRLAYNYMSGVLHVPAYEMNFLISAALGMFTVLPRLQGGKFALRFGGLALAMLLYWALTGNRFSAFLVTLSYFALPFAAVVAMTRKGILRDHARLDAWSVLTSARVTVPLAIMAASAALAGLVINSYYSVRNYADPVYHMTQRILVQPVQSWVTTWERVTATAHSGPDHGAIDYVILNPPVTEGNPTVRYLMEQDLGYFRARELIDAGQQFAGGYPEIFIQLFDPWVAGLLMLLLGIAASFLLYFAVRSLCQGRIMTAFMAVYLYYGFSVAYLGGMLSFVFATTYSLKIIALIIVYFAERYYLSRSPQRRRRNATRIPAPAAHRYGTEARP